MDITYSMFSAANKRWHLYLNLGDDVIKSLLQPFGHHVFCFVESLTPCPYCLRWLSALTLTVTLPFISTLQSTSLVIISYTTQHALHSYADGVCVRDYSAEGREIVCMCIAEIYCALWCQVGTFGESSYWLPILAAISNTRQSSMHARSLAHNAQGSVLVCVITNEDRPLLQVDASNNWETER